jgi:elongation factor Ts
MDKISLISEIRKETGFSVMDIKKALEESNYQKEKAIALLLKRGGEKYASREKRATNTGIIEAYSHRGKIGVLVEVLCETDFVAQNQDFQNFAHELALQVASCAPENLDELLESEYIRDPSRKIKDLLLELRTKIGENIKVGRFIRLQLGE